MKNNAPKLFAIFCLFILLLTACKMFFQWCKYGKSRKMKSKAETTLGKLSFREKIGIVIMAFSGNRNFDLFK